VTPPITRFPLSSPSKLAHMIWLVAKNRAMTWGSLLGIYFISSQKNGFSWPPFRANKGSCIPAAKALHAQMSEATAVADKETLRRICAGELFQNLAGGIDSRPPGIRTEWELVRYDSKWRYPRLADFRVSYQPMGSSKSGMRLLKQAVVSISSVQRLVRYDETKGGALVPGSERERHMLEHVVLQSIVDQKTFESGPWKVWGNLPEMPYETIRDDADMFAAATASKEETKNEMLK
jgi:protein MBA1